MRAPGQAIHKLPLFVWAVFVTAILLLLSLPVLAGVICAISQVTCWCYIYQQTCLENNLTITTYIIAAGYINISAINVNSNNVKYKVNFACLNDWVPGTPITPEQELAASYLAGLIEGDGSIVVPSRINPRTNKPAPTQIKVCFHLDDLTLAKYLITSLDIGSIHGINGKKAIVWAIASHSALVFFAHLLNGRMRTAKSRDLLPLIAYLNKKEAYIVSIPVDTSLLGSNAWLAGFIEADGSFQVRTSLSDTCKQKRITIYFELSQARLNHDGFSSKELITNIASFLNVSLQYTCSHLSHPQYRVRTSTVASHNFLVEYLTQYPLLGTKRINYMDWCTVHGFVVEGTVKEHVQDIVKIKAQINSKRTTFDWTHLS